MQPSAVSSPSLVPGALIAGRYRLERELGEGGMGTVWEAMHTVTKRSVAMKFLKESMLDKPLLRKRFLREAVTASALRHPNVVEVLDMFDIDERVSVLVMELLRGETLAAKLQRDERLSAEETSALLLPVISAVGTAHSMGIVHRDLKPENIFLVRDGDNVVVKVLDFGIAKVVSENLQEAQNPSLRTGTGTMLGTPCYMAPEQATGEGELDHRADIWSMGVILYECLSGTRPIEGDNLAQVITRLINAGIVPLATLAPGLPPDLSAAVMEMLLRDPGRRAQDLSEISRILSRHTRASVPGFHKPGSLSPEVESRVPASVAGSVNDVSPAISAAKKSNTKAATLVSSPVAPSAVTVIGSAPKKQRANLVMLVLLGGGLFVALAVMLSRTGPATGVSLGSAPNVGSPAAVAPSPPSAPAVALPVAMVPNQAPSSAPSSVQVAPVPHTAVLRPLRPISTVKRGNQQVSGSKTPSNNAASRPDEGALFSGRK